LLENPQVHGFSDLQPERLESGFPSQRCFLEGRVGGVFDLLFFTINDMI
jgi:hypothetical protein